MPVLDVSVTNTGTQGYWVAVDDDDVVLVNGQGQTKNLPAGSQHALIWWMTGNPGSSISIKVTDGARTVTEVKSSTIPATPPGNIHGAGFKRFTV